MWDEYERALVDAYQDWRNGMHKCGRPLTESLRVPGHEPPQYGFIKYECAACEATEREQARLQKAVTKADQDAGVNPAAWRDLQPMPVADIGRLVEEQHN